MIRKVIKIDEELCNGCGICVDACHEGAIGLVNGKAKLLRDDYCDGLGACLPTCPTGAISFEEREAAEFDEEAVKAHQAEILKKKARAILEGLKKSENVHEHPHFGGCPGSMARAIKREASDVNEPVAETESRLMQWPVQIRLVPIKAPYFEGANLLIAADCAAYAYANFHNKFMKNKITIIGCPKLDDVDYSEKLQAILDNNDIKSVTIVRMEVPCCGGIEMAAKRALQRSGKFISWRVVTIGTDGRIVEE